MSGESVKFGERGGAPAGKPTVLYDGECGFCRFWIGRWEENTGGRVEYRPFQEAGKSYPQLRREEMEEALQFVGPDGTVSSGAEAVFETLRYSGRRHRLMGLFGRIAALRFAAQGIYRFVARHRQLFSALTFLLVGRDPKRPTYLIARWLFVRALGGIYAIAFASLGIQILGLVGSRGIVPAADFLDAARSQMGPQRYWLVPTVCWLDASDNALLFLCWAGVAIGCAVLCGFFPSLGFFLLWALYLSLSTVCSEFLGFQWDILLLEAGVLAIFLAWPKIWPDWRRENGAARAGRWLLLYLLFRLLFESGIVKLTYDDPTWRDLTALTYHYHTQPLPIWTSWHMEQAPLWFQKLSVLFTYAVELAAPFAIFGPRNVRRAGCLAIASLQMLIAATGNYAFFNLLTIALCLPLLDDGCFPEWLRRRFAPMPAEDRGRFSWTRWIIAPIAASYLVLTGVQLFAACWPKARLPQPLAAVHRFLAPLRSINGYGLFRVMTLSRPELIIEGSDDGATWREYEFKWKPGNLEKRPGLVAPHQPRLDWQMWFAALGSIEQNPWFVNFLVRLLEGSPDVLNLLAVNPFPERPPKFLRVSVYEYRFTRASDHTAAWWKREFRRPYCPVLSLRGVAPVQP